MIANLGKRKTTMLAGAIVAINGFFPALWIFFTSLKTETELLRYPITIVPEDPTLQNYTRVFVDQPILLFMWNSVVVASLSTLLCIFVSALAAYAITSVQTGIDSTAYGKISAG